MKRPLGTLLIALTAYGAPAITAPRPAHAAPAPGDASSPEALYDEGRQAYRLGDFATSVEKWEAAYAASDNALLLYNISLAYRGRYTITGEIADLRRARAVLDNFIKVAEADPDLDVDDAPEKLVEIDKQIADAEEQARENPEVAAPVAPPVAEPKRPEPTPDPGRKLRLAGIGTMIGGGAAIVAGAATMGYYFAKSTEFTGSLKTASNEFDSRCVMGSESVETCDQIQAQIDFYRKNGRKADERAILAISIGGGIGVLALVAGGLIFNEGNKRTKLWEKKGFQSLRIVPTRRGFSVSGRF